MSSKLEKARSSMTNLRRRIEGREPIRAASAFGAGAIVGTLERRGTLPITVVGLPVKPLLALGGYTIAMQSAQGRNMHAIFAGAGDGLAGAYGYAAGKAGTLIAGGDDEQLMDEDEEEEVIITGDDEDDD